jgi:hypothetical protein
MAVEIFISYKRNDPDTQSLFEPLLKVLRRFRYKPVYDTQDLDAGEPWESTIEDKIEHADFFVLLLSEAASRSEQVKKERDAANRGYRRRKRPRIIPVGVNFEPRDVLEELTWHSGEDPEPIAIEIRKIIRKARRWGVIARTAAAIAAALLLAFVAFSSIQITRLTDPRTDEGVVLAAYAQLKGSERLLVPRLWLSGRWAPETMAAQAFETRAAPMLQSSRRACVDHGLLLHAQAAALRNAPISAQVWTAYSNELHYDLLVTTIDAGDEISNRSLTANAGPARWIIAAGNRVWSCPQPLGQQPCGPLMKSRHQSHVISEALVTDQTLLLAEYLGERRLTRLNLDSGVEEDIATEAAYVAADRGDVAIAFDHRQPGTPSVRIDLAGNALGPEWSGDLGRLREIAFGPCDDCISMIEAKGTGKVWRRGSGRNQTTPLGDGLLQLAATRVGHRLAFIDRRGRLAFSGADPRQTTPGPTIDLRGTGAMSISPDGRRLAVVHDERVTIFEQGKDPWTLIDASRTPTPVAAVFAGNDYVVTRTPWDVRIWRLGSAEQRDLQPQRRLAEWRKKLGLAAAGADACRK